MTYKYLYMNSIVKGLVHLLTSSYHVSCVVSLYIILYVVKTNEIFKSHRYTIILRTLNNPNASFTNYSVVKQLMIYDL